MSARVHFYPYYFKGGPCKYGARYYEDYEMDDEVAKFADEHSAHEAWYVYGSGGYEGNGALILRRHNEFAIKGLCHCSCYGPLDRDEIVFDESGEEHLGQNCKSWDEVDFLVDKVKRRNDNA